MSKRLCNTCALKVYIQQKLLLSVYENSFVIFVSFVIFKIQFNLLHKKCNFVIINKATKSTKSTNQKREGLGLRKKGI